MFASARLDHRAAIETPPVHQGDPPGMEAGPRDWSSLSLEERLFAALERSPHVPKRTLRFETEPGCVRIHGVVRSYFQKQMVQEVVRRAAGEVDIVNDLDVATQ